MRQRAFPFIYLLLLLASCATPKLSTRANQPLRQLGICVEYDKAVSEEAQRLFDRQLHDFILKYNSEPHAFRLQHCANPEEESLRLYIAGTRLVNSAHQTVSIALTALGLSMPFVMISAGLPFFPGFYYLPMDVSKIQLSLSDDISQKEGFRIKKRLYNSGFMLSMERQLHKHTHKFGSFLEANLRELERNYKKVNKGGSFPEPETEPLITKSSQTFKR